ncbi:DapH/DapD/GlmU-related protein [Okibacterium sp. HSC-33S16]|uniref:acyltransferase n=1 Tax=Okibacterium sp. HSC-33S16 TaxID=2910965 RepID=UPI0020A1397E|nr:DapH/DapD/GlmU-related protein [Okibacterium sp. HSC-33S16]
MVAIALIGRTPIHRLRVAVIRAFGADVSNTAVLYHGFQIRAARRLRIGPNTSVGDGAILDARGGLTIGANVNFSTGVQIWTAQHSWQSADFDYEENAVTIGDHVWIGPRVTVLPGAVVGEGAVVAAGAVVKGNIAPFTLVGGVPARKLGDRPRDLRYTVTKPRLKTWWW